MQVEGPGGPLHAAPRRTADCQQIRLHISTLLLLLFIAGYLLQQFVAQMIC